jgi:polyhydroxyalkanoate synthesis regulator phasin
MYQLHVRATALATLFLLAFVALGDDAGPRPAPQDAVPTAENGKNSQADDALLVLNNASRDAYRRAREEALARCGPIVVLEGNDLVLVYGLYRCTAHVTPDLYHTLKSISHIPLAVHALLDSRVGEFLDDQSLDDLKQYRARVTAAASGLGGHGLGTEQLKRGKIITDESLALLARVIEARREETEQLDEYRHRMRSLLEANAAEAARAQIDALHRQMKTWKDQLTDAEWAQLRVMVMGMQLPRQGNLAVQYFARLLGEAGQGRRIVYAESIFDESRALDLLATRVVDTRIGTVFFEDPARMHRDLLSDGAKQYLDELFPNSKP